MFKLEVGGAERLGWGWGLNALRLALGRAEAAGAV